MDFLKSYAHQVVSYHPEKGRDDLFVELYNELCEEFADWQLEHPGEDQTAFLDAQKDHPMRFATRLAPEGSMYLIGPQFYYSFISALKVGLMVTVGFHLFLGVIPVLSSGVNLGSIMRILMSTLGTLVWVSASILGVFIALERSGEKASWLDGWRASKLVASASHQPVSRTETYFDLGISLVGLLWLLDIVQFPAMIHYDGIWVTGWTANLPDGFWVAAGIMLVLEIAYCIIRLIRNFWSPRMRIMTIVFNIVWAALLSYAASQPQLVSVNADDLLGMKDLQPLINKITVGILYFVTVVLAIEALSHGWKLLKRNQDGLNPEIE